MTAIRLLTILAYAGSQAMAEPALAQPLTGGGGVEISAVRIVAALLVCLAATFALVLAVRSRGGKFGGMLSLPGALGRRGRIRLIETRRISHHADICLVECDGAEYLLLCGPGSLQVLEARAASPCGAAAEPA